MTELRRELRLGDGLAIVIGIIIGSGIFRTPGLVAARLGQPWLTFVAWVLGGALALCGALVFAELATRLPKAGGKYVYAREAFGRRAGFVVGWVESLGLYTAAIAAIGTVAAEYVGRLVGAPPAATRWIAVTIVVLFIAINQLGVSPGKWVQNIATGAKILALGGVVIVAFAAGTGAGWRGALPTAPHGLALWGALAVASQSVIWTYYGYGDAAKIAEEVVEPNRTLPRIYLIGVLTVTVFYLLLNAAFLHVLPIEQVAGSNLVAGDVMTALIGDRAGTVVTVLALIVVLGSLNGNVFVTPRVLFGLGRERLAPRSFALVNKGGSPWGALVAVGAISVAYAASGTFERLQALAIVFVLLIDGFMVLALFRLRARQPDAPFKTPLYPLPAVVLLGVYGALLVGAIVQQPGTVALASGVLAGTYGLSFLFRA
jgi:APA family basic amino acid/polyamine antiporter